MQLAKVRLPSGENGIGVVVENQVRVLDAGGLSLSDILHAESPGRFVAEMLGRNPRELPLPAVTLLPPVDQQEIWAAGVTYRRSQKARERESEGAARFYDLVYSAPRPELFFKATPQRVVGPGGAVRIRRDSRWSVPEPELALVLSPALRLVGFTIGNDMSARDIEGENPLYLPQAKVYDQCCALGPVVTLADAMPPPERTEIRLTIDRQGRVAFDGSTSAGAMARSFTDLIAWLGREASFPHGAILLTGTGIVPPDDFALQPGDKVIISISGIGHLANVVDRRE